MKQFLGLIFILFLFTNCEDDPVDYTTISGQWRCQELGNETKTYIIDIEKGSASDNNYAIYNFNKEGNEQRVFSLYRNDSLFIETQFIGTSSKSVEGHSVIAKDRKSMQINYYLIENNGTKTTSCDCTHK